MQHEKRTARLAGPLWFASTPTPTRFGLPAPS